MNLRKGNDDSSPISVFWIFISVTQTCSHLSERRSAVRFSSKSKVDRPQSRGTPGGSPLSFFGTRSGLRDGVYTARQAEYLLKPGPQKHRDTVPVNARPGMSKAKLGAPLLEPDVLAEARAEILDSLSPRPSLLDVSQTPSSRLSVVIFFSFHFVWELSV